VTSLISGVGNSVTAVAAAVSAAEGAIVSGIAAAEVAIPVAIAAGEAALIGKAAILLGSLPQLQTVVNVVEASGLANEATRTVAIMETWLARDALAEMVGNGVLGKATVDVAASMVGEFSAAKFALDSAFFTIGQVLAEGITSQNVGALVGAVAAAQSALARAAEMDFRDV
jgi:hypothetical protein